jgi:hypothetical protein
MTSPLHAVVEVSAGSNQLMLRRQHVCKGTASGVTECEPARSMDTSATNAPERRKCVN